MNTNATINDILQALNEKGVARIAGFGKFELVKRKARIGRNFKTGEPVDVPEHFAVNFKTGEPVDVPEHFDVKFKASLTAAAAIKAGLISS